MVIIEQTYRIEGDLGCGLVYQKPITMINNVINRDRFIITQDLPFYDTLDNSEINSSDETRNKR